MIAIFQPPTDNELTGGYLYNRRVAAELDDVEIFRVPPRALGSALARRADPDEPVLLDSLYIDDEADLETVSRARATALIHHLPSLDPTFPEDQRGAQRRREDEFLAATRAHIVTSDFMRQVLYQRGVGKPVHACPPGVDDAFFAGTPERTGDTPEVLTVANLEPRKGYLEHIDALARLSRRRSFHWHIVGDAAGHAEYARLLRHRLSETGLSSRVTMHGRLERPELLALMRRASAHLFPTRFESFGMVVTESLAAGVPVIAPRLGEIAALVRHGETGLLAPPHDPGALVHELGRALDDEALLTELWEKTLARRCSLPRWTDAARRLREALREAA